MAIPPFRPRSALIATWSLLLLVLFLCTGFTPSALPLIKGAQGSNPNLLDHVSNRTLGVGFTAIDCGIAAADSKQFQRILAINLPSRTDLRDSMSLAAALTDLDIEYVDGVTDVDEKSLPPGAKETNLAKGSLCAWRAHMNVLRMIVEQGLTSALVLENDVDWDLRIKQQMHDFALASQLLLQPLAGTTDRFLDPSHPAPVFADELPANLDVRSFAGATTPPATSPYGDPARWDLLWLGHCGTRFPQASDGNALLGRAVLSHDATVPEQQHLDVENGGWELLTQYPAHTRVAHRARGSTCTLGYAVTQAGARRLLLELAIRNMTGTADMMFRSVCDGVAGRPLLACLTVQPPLFAHHRRAGDRAAFSDINDRVGWNERAYTRNVRWSTRLNFDRLLWGRTDYVDLFVDGEPRREFPE